eukprot:UN09565
MYKQYQERTKLLNQAKLDQEHPDLNEAERRLLRAAEEAQHATSLGLIGSEAAASEGGLLNSLTSQNVSDATRALEQIQQQKSAVLDKDYYVIDRNKYNGRD